MSKSTPQKPSKPHRPIALISDSTPDAIQWVLINNKDNVAAYHSGRRTVDLKDGTVYEICTMPEHLLAIRINEYKVLYGHRRPVKWFDHMERLAKTRIVE